MQTRTANLWQPVPIHAGEPADWGTGHKSGWGRKSYRKEMDHGARHWKLRVKVKGHRVTSTPTHSACPNFYPLACIFVYLLFRNGWK